MATSKSALAPLIKWSGGKRSEIPLIKDAYPKNIKRVVEPFSGGAAVSFDLNPDRIILNDVSSGLVAFYQALQQPTTRMSFMTALKNIDQARKEVAKFSLALTAAQVQAAVGTKSWITNPQLSSLLLTLTPLFPKAIEKSLCKDIQGSLASKMGTRIPNLEAKTGEAFDLALRRKHLETAIQAGIYTTLRRIYNQEYASLPQGLPAGWAVAAWYAVRSLCYSGMFRYGANGKFNVPYGGIGYNSRDFASSVSSLTAPAVVDFMSRTEVNQLDFEDLFKKYNYFGPGDFIFVDPPYDSAFSQYNADGDFDQADQKRLAQVLEHTSAPWMLVIKNTPFILSLYQKPGMHRGVFGKNYQVNFRNRHDRGVEHLVVTNYPFTAKSITPL